ncbi:hypothetical protein ACHMXB_04705 [Arthrobacter sp. UC242_113]|uniref:hypothetical protein n=1 Tax=Arthrobacter sp. UC242_113 TaxID=3374550 RepID=UPI0037584D62
MKKQEDTTNRTGANPVKYQERGKEDRARFFSRHVAQATNVHEQVTNDTGSISKASKEATGQQ